MGSIDKEDNTLEGPCFYVYSILKMNASSVSLL